MVNILPCTPHLVTCGMRHRRFRVEWDDSDGLTRERFFDSYKAAERFAVEIERLLISELADGVLDAA